MNGAFALAKGPKISLLTGTVLQDVLLTFNFSASSSHIDLHISIFSFLGIMLGVATLIIVMSVMNGFRSDLTEKILGFNSHLTIACKEAKKK